MPDLPNIAFGVGKVSGAPAPRLAFGSFNKGDSFSRERLVGFINILDASTQKHPTTDFLVVRERLFADHFRSGGYIQQDKILVFQPECVRMRVAKRYRQAEHV